MRRWRVIAPKGPIHYDERYIFKPGVRREPMPPLDV
jgi:hypothetical protein